MAFIKCFYYPECNGECAPQGQPATQWTEDGHTLCKKCNRCGLCGLTLEEVARGVRPKAWRLSKREDRLEDIEIKQQIEKRAFRLE